MGEYDGYTSNRIDAAQNHDFAGRIYGRIDWKCPDCGKPRKDFAEFSDTTVSCCQVWYLSLLLWRSVQSQPIIVPHDWIVNFNEKTPHLSDAAEDRP